LDEPPWDYLLSSGKPELGTKERFAKARYRTILVHHPSAMNWASIMACLFRTVRAQLGLIATVIFYGMSIAKAITGPQYSSSTGSTP
jgi:hypothetical protein